MNTLYTIGYTSYRIEEFVKTLQLFSIKALVDVRSLPYSSRYPEYNKENLKVLLQKNNIFYLYFGDGFGARPDCEDCYINNEAMYSLIARTSKFKEYKKRIINGLEKYNIVLLCAETDPLRCHRNILICRNIKNDFSNISHILKNNIIEKNTESEKRLLKEYSLEQNDLFSSFEDRLESAYDMRSKEIQYKRNNASEGDFND